MNSANKQETTLPEINPVVEAMLRAAARNLGHEIGDFDWMLGPRPWREAHCRKCGHSAIYSPFSAEPMAQFHGESLEQPCRHPR